jgi:hypothetical protein
MPLYEFSLFVGGQELDVLGFLVGGEGWKVSGPHWGAFDGSSC